LECNYFGYNAEWGICKFEFGYANIRRITLAALALPGMPTGGYVALLCFTRIACSNFFYPQMLYKIPLLLEVKCFKIFGSLNYEKKV